MFREIQIRGDQNPHQDEQQSKKAIKQNIFAPQIIFRTWHSPLLSGKYYYTQKT
jgi:hypothetical protein